MSPMVRGSILGGLAAAIAAAATPAANPGSFTVYSEPVESRYGEVHNRVRFGNNSGMPADVVARYASGEKLMAISGFDVDVVRKHPDGSESQVLLSDHYLHHYVLYFGQAKAMEKMMRFAEENKHAAHMIKGCHAMQGGGARFFKDQLEQMGEAPYPWDWVYFGSAAGAEYRHNSQRFEKPFRLILHKPEVWAPTMHIINTKPIGNTTDVSGPPPVSRLLECPCTPQRKIDVAAGTIDGKPADPPIGCSKEFAATGNPSCHLSTYVGGLRCCEDGVFLIDTDKECADPGCTEKPVDSIQMKFTFHYEDAQVESRQMETAACCDVTSSQQFNENIEYDITTCPAGTPSEQCTHVAESVQPIGQFDRSGKGASASDLVDLVFAEPHLHWAGKSLELFDHETGELICEVHHSADNSGGVMYGNGSLPGNEMGYLVGLRTCSWNGTNAPRFRRDHLLRSRAVYNATSYHTGVMSLWIMQVSAVPDTLLV